MAIFATKRMRMESTEKKISAVINAGGQGKVYFPADFFDCGTPKAVSKALQRLVRKEKLMRLSRGIYCTPVESHWGMGMLPASSQEVAEAIADRDGIRLGPTACEAQNALGLSEQVVVNPVYSTDGPYREIYYRDGFRPIIMYHVSPRMFSYKSKVMMLVNLALEDIGKENLWQFDMDALESLFHRVPYEEIRSDLRKTPAWIRNIVMGYYGKAS